MSFAFDAQCLPSAFRMARAKRTAEKLHRKFHFRKINRQTNGAHRRCISIPVVRLSFYAMTMTKWEREGERDRNRDRERGRANNLNSQSSGQVAWWTITVVNPFIRHCTGGDKITKIDQEIVNTACVGNWCVGTFGVGKYISKWENK